jgi:glucose-6-phosphate 1-epimerase
MRLVEQRSVSTTFQNDEQRLAAHAYGMAMARRREDSTTLGDLIAVSGHDGSRALVSLHGSHVVSWQTADGRERLFLSDRATAVDGAAIRGGIPVCFPQFAALGPLRKHGFARTSRWHHLGGSTFALDVAADAWDGWPHRCTLQLDVLLGPSTLTTMLRVLNTGDASFAFTGALHTYLACNDISDVVVSGLDGCAVHSGGRVEGNITFGAGADDVDLSVLAADGPVRVDGLDRAGIGSMLCAQTGFGDVVVWNVGERLGAAMNDLGAGQSRNFVCVEAAAVEPPIVVPPRSSWVGSQTLTVL